MSETPKDDSYAGVRLVSEAEIRKIVKDTVAETLTALGVDSENPIEFQKDMAHVRAWRNSTDKVKSQSLMAAVGVITLGGLGLIWQAIKGSN